MKRVLYFVLALHCLGLQAKEKEVIPLKSYQFECIDETKVDAALVIQLKAGTIWEKNFPLLKKWALCVLKKLELMSGEGVFKMDIAMKRIQESDKLAAEKVIDECLSTKAIPPPEIAWQYIKCLNKKDQKGNFTTINIV